MIEDGQPPKTAAEFDYPPTDEVEIVAYDPSNDTDFDKAEGFGRKTVNIDGRALTIHDTNNFRLHVAVYIGPQVQSENLREGLRLGKERIYAHKMKVFEQVMPKLQQSHPKLYEKIVEIVTEDYTKMDQLQLNPSYQTVVFQPSDYSQEEKDLGSYYLSMAYDAAANIAKQDNSKVDLRLFYA
ncbi:MAG TPA: hypothetical protein VMT23_01800 [Candidatus Binatia bacterium]|nr:hypothetical protein [Candidatus Binatia bacterium]